MTYLFPTTITTLLYITQLVYQERPTPTFQSIRLRMYTNTVVM